MLTVNLRAISLAACAGLVVLCAAYPACATVTYVKICDAFGPKFMYIPGTATCLNPDTGETITQTDNGPVYGQSQLKQDIDDAAAGTAVSLSLPGAVVDPGKSFGAAVNLGYFDNSTALGVSGAYRPVDGVTVNGGVGVSTGSGQVGGRAGVNFSW